MFVFSKFEICGAAASAGGIGIIGRLLLGTVLIFTGSTAVWADTDVELGRRIYEEGILPSGAKLEGVRFDKSKVTGEEASCAKCHRQSGMGSKEGKFPVPPVTGGFLFGGARLSVVLTDPSSPKNVIQSQQPYTDTSLATAIRKGTNRQGKPMNVLMPRYALDKAAMKALTAYLKQLSARLSPGVDSTSIHFATIIAPGVDPLQREAMLKMMQRAFQQRNSSHTSKAGRGRAQVQEVRRIERKWHLAVWELQGDPETWDRQLQDYYSREPVFAVISGISTGTWAPVHAFCDRERLPCLFPSVDLPEPKESFYSLYFSRGAALEADVLANQLLDANRPRPKRVVQIRRENPIARAAAEKLRQALVGAGIAVEERVSIDGKMAEDKNPLEGLEEQDALVFWLPSSEMAILAKRSATLPTSAAYFSATLAGGDASGIPSEWKSGAALVSPYETGDRRKHNTQRLHQWLMQIGQPLVNERFQSEVFFNLVFLSDITMHMLDNYYRDYLVERTEDMLSQSTNPTVYPRLSLGPHQRFASKGAYIARFDADGKLVGEGDWIVP